MWFAIDTLEFLKRGGRIGAASAWIGSTLKVKPILTVENEMAPVERVRTSARMFERMVDYAKQRHDSDADAWVVQHINAPEQADRLDGALPRGVRVRPALHQRDRSCPEHAHRPRPARRRLRPHPFLRELAVRTRGGESAATGWPPRRTS